MAQSLKAVGRETLDTLQGIKSLMGSLTSAVGDLNGALAGMTKPIDEGGRALKRWGDSLHDVVDTTEEGIDNYKEILSLTTKLHRMGASDQKEREKTQQYLKELNKEYEKAKKFHEGDTAKLKEIAKVTNSIEKAMAAGTSSAEEFAEAVAEVSANAKKAKGSLGNLSFENSISSAHKLGKSLDDGISGALRGLKLLDNFGFKGLFGNLANMQMRIKQIKDETQKSGQARAAQYSRAAGNAMQDFTSGNLARRERGFTQLGGLYRNAETPEARAGLVRQLSGKTGVLGILDRQLGKRALASAGSGSMGLLGKAGMGMMEAGGGSVLGGAAMQMAGPAAAIYGLLQLFQQGFDRNKDIYSKLGKGGIVQGGGRMGENYNAWSQALEPGGFGMGGQGKGAARYYDLDFEKMTDMMKIVVESGQALQTNYGKINQGMTPDQALAAPRASNIYSGVIRNGAMFGKNIGLDTTESTQLTMKLMHEFSLSMGEVEDMFVHIGKAVQSTGISTVSYLKLLDDVTGEFDKLNKSLNFTCGLMLLLGKNATYTSDDIQKMVKGLEGDKKTYEQSIFAYERMGEKGRMGFAKSMEATYKATGAKLIGEGKITEDEMKNASDEALRNKVTPGHPEETAEMERFIKERKRGQGAMKDHSALALATQAATMGETPQTRIATQLSLLKVAMPEGTKLSDFMGATAGAKGRVQSLEKSPEFLKVAEHLNVHPENLTTQLGQAGHQILAGIKEAAQMNPATEEGKAARAQFSSIGPKEWESIAKNVKAGKDITEMKPVQAVFNDLAAQRLADNITEAETKAAKDTAEENQRYITGPLDYIQKALKALVEHIITLLETVVNFVNRYFFKTDMQALADQKASAQAYREKELQAEAGPLKSFEEAAKSAKTPEDKKRFEETVSVVKAAQAVAGDYRATETTRGNLLYAIHQTLDQKPGSFVEKFQSEAHLNTLKNATKLAQESFAETMKKEKGLSSGDVAAWDPNDADTPSRQKLLDVIAGNESGGRPDNEVYNLQPKNKKGKVISSAWGKYQQLLPTAKSAAEKYLGGFDEDLWRGRNGHTPEQAVGYQTLIQNKLLDEVESQSNYQKGIHKTAYELFANAEGEGVVNRIIKEAKDNGMDWLKVAATDPTILKDRNLPGIQRELSRLYPGNSYTTILSADASVNTDGAVTVPSHSGEQAPLRGDGQIVYEAGKGGKI